MVLIEMKDSVDVVYVVASKLGSIGMGTTAYNATKKLENSGLKYKIFCRGHNKNLKLNEKNIISAGYLEYLSLPLRFAEKKLHMKISPFEFVNKKFGGFVLRRLPKCKIYHMWMHVPTEIAIRAKEQGAILILEGANSHPVTCTKILNYEFENFNKKEYMSNLQDVKRSSEIYKNFDYIMCPSDFVYNSFLENGFEKEKLIKMPYGVNTQKFVPGIKKGKKFRLAFVGSLQLRKGIQYLLKAWSELKLKNAQLLVVGRVWPDAVEVVEKYKKNPTIKFLGFDRNPLETLQQSDVFVSPSLEEGSALTVYEAMACGLPIIATKNTGCVAANKKDGFIIPIRDVKSLKEKIKYFYDNPNEIKRMGKNARKRVEQFSWDNYGERLKSKYLEILDNES